jgi:drug/metabolite transporter (DMT)-like permease
MSGKQRGVLFTVLASLLFGLSPVFMKLILDFVNVETMNVLFTSFTALCFVVLFAAFKRIYFRSILEKWRKVALLGLFSTGGALFYTYGIFLCGPVNAAFLIQFATVFTILFGVALFKEKFTRLETAGVLLAIVGVFVLVYGDLALEIMSTLVLLSAALLLASANIVSKAYVKDLNPIALAGGNSMTMLLFIFAYAVLSGRLETTFSPMTLVYALVGSVAGGFLSFILFFKALQIFEVSKVAAIRTMEPFLTAIFSLAILALTPTANQLLGGALIMVGVVGVSLTKGKQAPSPKQTSP